jgi:hypothetical protein
MTTKRRFTDQMLDRLNPPKAGRLELADDVFPGLVLRVTPSGAKTFGATRGNDLTLTGEDMIQSK